MSRPSTPLGPSPRGSSANLYAMSEKSRDRERGEAEQALLAAEHEGHKIAKAKEDAAQPAGAMRE